MNEASILVNGREHDGPERSLVELLERLGYCTDRQGIAVAVNGEVVPRGCWRERALSPGDEIEIVGAVQGG